MRAWRIAAARFARLDGEGARLHGGRWNSPGRPAIYASAHLSLAMLEMLVRLPTGDVPADFVQVAITIPDDLGHQTVRPTDVPGWNARDRRASRRHGDAWLTGGESVALLVPSVSAPIENNILINPRHSEFAHIEHGEPEPVIWDARLFERGDESEERST